MSFQYPLLALTMLMGKDSLIPIPCTSVLLPYHFRARHVKEHNPVILPQPIREGCGLSHGHCWVTLCIPIHGEIASSLQMKKQILLPHILTIDNGPFLFGINERDLVCLNE